MRKNSNWSKSSWQNYDLLQKVPFDTTNKDYIKILKKISSLPSIVRFEEVKNFRELIKKTKTDNYFILQIGECAESFKEFGQSYIDGYKNLYSELENIITSKIIKVARLGGQFSKPRSVLFETRGDLTLPNYRGDMINEVEYSPKARSPNYDKIIEAYCQAAITTCVTKDDFYLSHEALFLDYEEQYLKKCELGYFSAAAHFLWVGRLTNFFNSAHIEFISGIYNSVAIKIDKNFCQIDLEEIIKKVGYSEGKLCIIGRFGAKFTKESLIKLIPILQKYPEIIYIIDPMHGNGFVSNNLKTRNTDDIIEEIIQTFNIMNEHQLKPNGVMLEAYFGDVQECIGFDVNLENLGKNYTTRCDPRLNHTQTLEITTILEKLIKNL